MQAETDYLDANNTWSPLNIPEDKNTISLKCIFQIKMKKMAQWTGIKQELLQDY